MKQLWQIYVMEILLFIVLLAGSVWISVPLSTELDKRLAQTAQGFVQKFEDNTGLSLSYSALSPSIFRKIVITGLRITDTRTGFVLANIHQVSLTYDLYTLLRGKIDTSLKKITVKNGVLHVNTVIHKDTLERLSSRSDTGNSSFSGLGMKIGLQATNLRVLVSDPFLSLDSQISSGSFSLGNGQIGGKLEASLSVLFPTFEQAGTVRCSVSLDTVMDLETGSGNSRVRLKSIDSKIASLSSLAFVLSVKDGVVGIDSVQNIQPFDIHSSWFPQSRTLTASFVCDRLQPFRWIELKNTDAMIRKLNKSFVSGSVDVVWKPESGLEYTVDLSSVLPAAFFGGGSIDCSLAGTGDSIDISSLFLQGLSGSAFLTGSYDLGNHIPEGYASINGLAFPGLPAVSADVYVQGTADQIELLLPELAFGDSNWTSVSVQAGLAGNRIDFSASAYDSSGKLGFEGSWLTGTQSFFEAYASLDSVSVSDSLAAVFEIPALRPFPSQSRLMSLFKEYELTTEVYISSDFSSFSYNLPRLVLASTVRDGYYVLLSSNGTENGIELHDIEVSLGSKLITGGINASRNSFNDIVFSSTFLYGSLPYEISGLYSNRTLSLFGSYNLSSTVFFDVMGGINGRASCTGFPVSSDPFLFSINLESDFTVQPDQTWKLHIQSASVEEMGSVLPLSTVLSLSGSVDPSGAFFDSVVMSDSASEVSGSVSLTLIPSIDGTQRVTFDTNLESGSGAERYRISGQLFKSADLFFEGRGHFEHIPLSRFLKRQTDSNYASLDFTLSGTPGNILATAHISDIVYRIGEFDLDAQTSIVLEDGSVSFSEGVGSWHGNTFSNINGVFSLESFSGSMSASYQGVLGKRGLSALVSVAVDSPDHVIRSESRSLSQLVRIPEMFTVKADLSSLSWGGYAFKNPITCMFVRQPGITEVFAGKNRSVSGYLIDDGTFSLSSTGDSPLLFQADGYLDFSTVDITVNGIHSDLPRLTASGAFDRFSVLEGTLDGELQISGIMNDPDFSGNIQARNIRIAVPSVFSDVLGPFSFTLDGQGKNIAIPAFTVPIGTGMCSVDAAIEFDRWIPSGFSFHIATDPKRLIPLDITSSLVRIKSFFWADLSARYDSAGLVFSGKSGIERGYIAVSMAPDGRSDRVWLDSVPDFLADLSLAIGKKVEFRGQLDALTIIRGLVIADKPLSLEIDTRAGTYRVRGETALKGGEIFYFKRNFYLREGRIVLNESQNIFDPLITVRAEIRERDSEGKPVRIILGVDNQPLTSFTPVFTSDPLKSETEILILLGQITAADSSRETLIRDTVVTASDLLTQISVFRNAENALRDILNLDIFSVRTLILQNAVLGSALQTGTESAMSIGNYFDNTTVYMGKYLGSAMYADLLTHFSYYDPKSVKNAGDVRGVYGNMLIQPELGLEVATPLFMLRWAIMPVHPDTLFVADNSVTLSWKFSY